MAAEQATRFDAFDMWKALDNYITRNSRSSDVNDRWLADYLIDARDMAGFVRNNNLPEQTKDRVAEFRCAEIEEEKKRKQLEIDNLDGEMRRLKTKAIAL